MVSPFLLVKFVIFADIEGTPKGDFTPAIASNGRRKPSALGKRNGMNTRFAWSLDFPAARNAGAYVQR